MQFIDEQDHVPIRFRLLQEHLHPLLEISAESGAREHPHQIHGNDPLLLQVRRHSPFCDPLGQPFHDRRLADPRLPG